MFEIDPTPELAYFVGALFVCGVVGRILHRRGGR